MSTTTTSLLATDYYNVTQHDPYNPYQLTQAYQPQQTYTGYNGGEALSGSQSNDLVYGLGGNDQVHGGWGHDLVYGDYSNQYGPEYGYGNDYLDGGHGHDKMFGGYGNDHMVGGYGYDYMEGGHGNDRLNAYGTHSTYYDVQIDYMKGGAGYDTYVFGGSSWGVSYYDVTGGNGYGVVMDWQQGYDKIEVYDSGHASYAEGTYKGYSLEYKYVEGIGDAQGMDTAIYFTNQSGQKDLIGIVADSTNVNIQSDFTFV